MFRSLSPCCWQAFFPYPLRAAAAPVPRLPGRPSPSPLPMQAESTELLTQPLPLRPAGALSGDTFTLTASTVATPSSPAGTYSIVPVATGANLANYNVVYVNGTLTVSKAILTVTPNNQSIVAGSVLPSLSATITGFVNGDTQAVVTGSPALSTTATSSSPAGSYPITATLGTLAAANYSFTFGTGTLTITPATIPVSASPERRWPEPNRSSARPFSSTPRAPPETALQEQLFSPVL